MRQRWSGLLFLHWPFDPDLIASRLPKGLHVDTFGGKAWVGIVPFFMERVRPTALPPVPWLSWFMELNLRTYVHDEAGNPGVWFFSLDCNQPLAVEIAKRFFHLPYQHAAMRAKISHRRIRYTSSRKGNANAVQASYDYEIPPACQAADFGSLEWFLVERYLLFTANPQGEIFYGKVHHDPYQIAEIDCHTMSTEPFRLNGFPAPAELPTSVLAATHVDVKIYPLVKLVPPPCHRR